MSIGQRLNYWRRVFRAYLSTTPSQLTFWHEQPEANYRASVDKLGEYYMTLSSKADYDAHMDAHGIPLLDYGGALGRHYNPIAIAQFGLGNYNCFAQTGDPRREQNFLRAADWLLEHLEQNGAGQWVWNHHFDWEYRDRLRAPWYSALAQGQGISLLVRAHAHTANQEYLTAAERAFAPLLLAEASGGAQVRDELDDVWLEEYIVSPPTHILNGFLWALWGVHDCWLHTQDRRARALFVRCVSTLKRNLPRYDCGFWSLYELSGTLLPMIASPFYHSLHIVQLEIMHKLTGDDQFSATADRWKAYRSRSANRSRALAQKILFKVCYY